MVLANGSRKIQFCREQSSNIIFGGDQKKVFWVLFERAPKQFCRGTTTVGKWSTFLWKRLWPQPNGSGERVATGNCRRRSIDLRRRSIAGGIRRRIDLRRRIPIDRRRRLDPIRRRISDIQRRRGTFERTETPPWDDWLIGGADDKESFM